MHTRRYAADQENSGFSMGTVKSENAGATGKPSGLGGAGKAAGLSGKITGAGGGGGKGALGVQTRRGLRDITNKDEATAHAEGGKGGKKPRTRTASDSVAIGGQEAAARDSVPPPQPEPVVASALVAPTAPASVVAPAGLSGAAQARRSKLVPSARAATDIDVRDAEDPLAVTEYVEDLYGYLREREVETKVDKLYMTSQPNVNERMRSILIDWLVEVHLKFKLVPDTLYLTVYLIDKFLELEQVSRSNLQLVGVTAMLLASKYEEIYPPEIRDLVYITDRAYNKEQILEMESAMANALEFRLTVPTTYCFLLRYLKAAHADKKIVQLSCYVAERMLQEITMLDHLPSVVACCAIYVARRNLSRHPWSPTLEKYTRYCESDLVPCLKEV
ncbi:unnamed protein product, partial [Discosporangium mesarthrocarpum]